MQLTLLSPRKSLNKAYLKVKPSRSEIELFKINLIKMLDGLDESESEEHVKNDLSDFLKNTFFQKCYINTKGRNDLVIHNGPDAKSLAGVLIEAKKPSNKTEMIRTDNLNAKAFQELILYYLRERITNHNLEIKHLVATNIYEWFVFDAGLFEKLFAQNKTLVKQFTDFEEGRLSGNTTEFFYKQIAEPFLAGLTSEICFTAFDFREYEKPLRNDDKKDDSKLIALYKLLSPEHLLKLPFTNDSNSLDKTFYTELLHIIGLTETKEGSKKLIGRKKDGQRDPGSLIENAIIQIDSLDMISRIDKPSRFGETLQERLFNVSLELAITWINRILFMKLLEAQLINYHKSDPSYVFLTTEKINGYDSLNSLFFRVLARKNMERDPAVAKLFDKVPYLNSSLFEPTELERDTIFISNLQDDCLVPIHPGTVLKNNTGKRLSGNMNGLDYLFAFLDAYDFSGEGAEEIQEDNKTLINASVLGLIFEKINGYKDGSFFTPGFITMYMCRETIRRAVCQKFNDLKGWDCQDMERLYNKIEDRKEANEIINQLKICDPAVGSGHFLVSALNEIIAIKSELKILSDKAGKRLKEYHVEVVNDELIVTDEDGDLFEYNPTNPESQRIQETLFREKQTIIENCLFGVDINPNSVKICRLRLWIELLKNAYYLTPRPPLPGGEGEQELETLPNIDINIKCGNSLISRYALDADIKQALKKSKWSIDTYRIAVMSYRNASNKEEKRTMERLIESIKTDFETEVAANDKRLVQLKKLNGDLFNLTQQTSLFERTKKELADWNKQVNEQTGKIKKLETELEEIKNNKIYENAFEWRFEFPEVLNDEGDFVGFDVVIGNPPYIPGKDLDDNFKWHLKDYYKFTIGKFDVYLSFIEKGLEILTIKKNLCFIIPNTFLVNENAILLRGNLINNQLLNLITVFDDTVFSEAFVESIILQIDNIEKHSVLKLQDRNFKFIRSIGFDDLKAVSDYRIQVSLCLADDSILFRAKTASIKLGEIVDFCIGIQVGGEGNSKDFKTKYISEEKLSEEYKKFLDGKDFEPYLISWPKKYVNYGDWLHRKRDDKYFLNPKLIIRQIGETPVSTIDFECFYTLNTIYNGIVINSDFDIRYIFALIDSRFIKFIWKKLFFDGKALFPKIKKSQLNEIPIAKATMGKQEPIIRIVDQIFSSKKIDPAFKTCSLKKEIDQLVYELYGLTDEEIKIIEGEVTV